MKTMILKAGDKIREHEALLEQIKSYINSDITDNQKVRYIKESIEAWNL